MYGRCSWRVIFFLTLSLSSAESLALDGIFTNSSRSNQSNIVDQRIPFAPFTYSTYSYEGFLETEKAFEVGSAALYLFSTIRSLGVKPSNVRTTPDWGWMFYGGEAGEVEVSLNGVMHGRQRPTYGECVDALSGLATHLQTFPPLLLRHPITAYITMSNDDKIQVDQSIRSGREFTLNPNDQLVLTQARYYAARPAPANDVTALLQQLRRDIDEKVRPGPEQDLVPRPWALHHVRNNVRIRLSFTEHHPSEELAPITYKDVSILLTRIRAFYGENRNGGAFYGYLDYPSTQELLPGSFALEVLPHDTRSGGSELETYDAGLRNWTAVS